MKSIKSFNVFENNETEKDKIEKLQAEIEKLSKENEKLKNKIEKEMGKSVSEGVTHKDTKKPFHTKASDPDKKEDFRTKINSHVKSQGLKTKQVGNDFEILHDGDMIAQVMFRDDYIGVKKKGVKFVDEFKYNELGKIKSKITEIIKSVK